jgi:hypothetical protein
MFLSLKFNIFQPVSVDFIISHNNWYVLSAFPYDGLPATFFSILCIFLH